MNHREKARLQETLAQLSTNDRRRLYKQAAKLRKSSQGNKGAKGAHVSGGWQSEQADEAALSFVKLSRGTADSLDDWVLRVLSEGPEPLAGAEAEPEGDLLEGVVSVVAAGGCHVIARHRLVEFGDVAPDSELSRGWLIGRRQARRRFPDKVCEHFRYASKVIEA